MRAVRERAPGAGRGRRPPLASLVLVGVAALVVAGPPPLAAQETAARATEDRIQENEAEAWDPSQEELDEALRLWVENYVRYIITDEERRIFEGLESVDAKLAFVDRFWALRDPTPGTSDNEYRQQHLERFAFATRTFGAGKPGWATDRGRVYILLGPPNQLQRNPTGRGPMERASEVWSYNFVDHPYLPATLDLSFVDFRGTGEYELVSDLDAAAPVRTEQFGIMNNPLDLYALRRHADTLYDERLMTTRRSVDPAMIGQDFLAFQEQIRRIEEVPEIYVERLRSLRESVETEVSFETFPLDASVAFYEAEGGATAAQITVGLAYDELQGSRIEDEAHYSADLYAALERDGELVADDEQRLNFRLAPEQRDELGGKRILHAFRLLVPPGDYELVLMTRDNASMRVGRETRRLRVPELSQAGLRLSSITLASHVERAEAPASAGDPFRHGDLRVVPNVSTTFYPDQLLMIYLQAYGLQLDASGVNKVAVRGRILRDGKPFRDIPAQHPYPAPMDRQSFTLGVRLQDFPAGQFTVVVTVVDEISGASASRRADFEVRRES